MQKSLVPAFAGMTVIVGKPKFFLMHEYDEKRCVNAGVHRRAEK